MSNPVIDRGMFAGKRVLVMGLGRFGGGLDVVRFAHSAGAEVTITDAADASGLGESLKQAEGLGGVSFVIGSHRREDFESADIIVVNPAVPPDHELLEHARRMGKFVTTAINIFFALCMVPERRPTVVGISGSNGKSTTCALTAYLLDAGCKSGLIPSCRRVVLGGNIGYRPLLTELDRIGSGDIVVLELSSFQTEALEQVRRGPDIALVTNLSPNHLDRHGSFSRYCRAKENMLVFQPVDPSRPAVSIFNADDRIACRWYSRYSRQPGRRCIKFSGNDIDRRIVESFPLPGRANLANLAAALAVVRCFDVSDQVICRSLPLFKGLAHRLELVAEAGGVRWYDDSIATTPESTIAALESFQRPRIVIAGGYDKGVSFQRLGATLASSAKAVVLIGATAPVIGRAVIAAGGNARVVYAGSLAEAVQTAWALASPGDVVLLSPACASYDMFVNFEDRGRQFASLARAVRTVYVGPDESRDSSPSARNDNRV